MLPFKYKPRFNSKILNIHRNKSKSCGQSCVNKIVNMCIFYYVICATIAIGAVSTMKVNL